MNILLIAGHGGGDSGAVAFGREEAALTRSIVPKIKSSLNRYNCTCEIYDMSKSAYREIITNGKGFDFTRYDYVLEVHFNSYRQNSDGVTTGVEVYVTREERYITVEEAIAAKISAFGLKNRGVKRKNFDVIARAKSQGVSSALLEVCFLDDADDMKIYLAREGEIAAAIADSIAQGYNLTRKESNMAGFTDTANHWASAQIDALKELGIVNGYSDGTFRPNETITRGEVAALISRTIEMLR